MGKIIRTCQRLNFPIKNEKPKDIQMYEKKSDI